MSQTIPAQFAEARSGRFVPLGLREFPRVLCVLLASLLAATGAFADALTGAKAELEVYNLRGAQKLLQTEVAKVAEGTPEWQQVVFGLAVCAQHVVPTTRESIAEATRWYERLLASQPPTRLASRAMLNLGRIAELRDYLGDTPDLAGARQRYGAVVTRWPDEEIAHEAVLRIAGTHFQTYQPAEAQAGIAVLADWLKQHPTNVLAAAMWEYMADAYFQPLQDYRRAVECYRKADALGLMLRGKEGPIYWRVAVLAEQELQDRAIAVEYYTKIIVRTPTSGKAYQAQLGLKRLGAPVPEIKLLPGLAEAQP